MTTATSGIITVRAYLQAILNKDLQTLQESVHSDCVHTLNGMPPLDGDAFSGFVQGFLVALPDLWFREVSIFEDGDTVFMHGNFGGTHAGPLMGIPATGKPVSVTEMHHYRLRDGKIAEHHGVIDILSMMQQLGVAPQG